RYASVVSSLPVEQPTKFDLVINLTHLSARTRRAVIRTALDIRPRSPSLEAIHRSCSNSFSGNASILRRVERRHAATFVQPSHAPVITNTADHPIALAATSAYEIGHTSHGGGDVIVTHSCPVRD